MAKGKFQEWITPDGLTLLEGWSRNGLTDEQIAKNIGINRDTLYTWKKKFSDISDALKKGKEVVDLEVENALLKKALGFKEIDKVVATKREVLYENGKRIKETSEPVVVEVERYYPPETTAQIFWLKNRNPEKWRDKVQTEHSGSIATSNPFAGLTTEELKEFLGKE